MGPNSSKNIILMKYRRIEKYKIGYVNREILIEGSYTKMKINKLLFKWHSVVQFVNIKWTASCETWQSTHMGVDCS